MPEVFTVYNCGTAFNRDRRDELIADLAVRTIGVENVDFMICDGPGRSPGSSTASRAPWGSSPASAGSRTSSRSRP
jgi:hypothetical protein